MFTPKTKEEYTVAQSETPFAVPEVKQKSIQKSVQKSTAKQKSDIKTKRKLYQISYYGYRYKKP